MDFWHQELLVPQGAIGSAKIGCSQTNIVRLECWGFFLQPGTVFYSSQQSGKLKERRKIKHKNLQNFESYKT